MGYPESGGWAVGRWGWEALNSHLLGFSSNCDEVSLQSGDGLGRPSKFIPHSQPPAEGQSSESGGAGQIEQVRGVYIQGHRGRSF